MKLKLSLIFIFYINLSIAHSQFKYTLNGRMPSDYNNKLIYLDLTDYYSSNKHKQLDSTRITNNTFHFTGSLPHESQRAALFIKDKNGTLSYQNGPENFYMQFLVDSGNNTIHVNRVDSNYYVNKLKNIQITGSPTNDLFRQQDSLFHNFMGLYGISDHKDSGYSYLPKDKDVQLQVTTIDLIKKNPDNFYSLIYLRSELGMGRVDEETIFQAFSSLSERLKTSSLGIELSTLLKSRINSKIKSRVGNPVPEFAVQTFKGDLFKNADLKGTPYLIVFSATWCAPCQLELPVLLKLYNKYKDKGLKVVYFNLDDNRQAWAEHIKKNNLTWINVSEGTKRGISKISEQFYTYAIPNCFLIDKSGTVIYNSSEMDQGLVQLEKFIVKSL
jgi:thiol-disulfide isomerase/thioredoxin